MKRPIQVKGEQLLEISEQLFEIAEVITSPTVSKAISKRNVDKVLAHIQSIQHILLDISKGTK